jgi:hypothetical protein
MLSAETLLKRAYSRALVIAKASRLYGLLALPGVFALFQ